MTVAAIESRVAEIQAAMTAMSSGTTSAATTGTSTGWSFSDILSAQSSDVASLMDQAGSPDLSASDTANSAMLAALGLSPTGAGDSTDTTDSTGSTGSTGLSALTGSSGSMSPTGADVVSDAEKYLGVAYRWGGTNPATGLDCSGLVQKVMGDLGVTMPRTVSQQRNVGEKVDSMADAKPGDLLVFGTHHIGIYVGDGKMLHAPHTGDHVRISNVYETPTRIRRVLPADNSIGAEASFAAAATSSVRPSSLRASGAAGSSGSQYDAIFASATTKYHLPAGLLKAVASVESSFNANAVSSAGARGLMQLMPGTARSLGVNPMNPTQAVDGAAHLLSGLVKEFGSVKLALAAYNAGAGAVKKYGGVPPYRETESYVHQVLSRMES